MKKTLSIVLALVLALACLGTAAFADDNTIVVGASSTPHAEILEVVKEALAEEGYTLEIVVYDDYVLPNQALYDGELDANYFQHTPYLNSYNASNNTDLVSAALIHYEPFGLYGNGVDSVEAAPEGTTIVIPADDSNETRALLLLQQEGFITLPEDASAEEGISHLDIVDDGGYTITPVQADTVPSILENSDEGTLAVINGNYAIQGGLNAGKDALAVEDKDSEAIQTYANVLVVKEGNEKDEGILALAKALQSEEVKAFIEENYEGAVIAMF